MSNLCKYSFIVPALNAASTIGDVLAAILSETDHRCEVIVVDNGSKDLTSPIAAGFPGVIVLSCRQQGRSVARNFGAQHAKGKYLVFIDADTIIAPGWLGHLERFLDATPLDFVGTSVNPVIGESFLDRYREKLWLSKTAGTGVSLRKGDEVYPLVNTAACAIRRTTFHRVGGFDPKFFRNEDLELSVRMYSEGFLIGATSKCRSTAVYNQSSSEISRFFSYLRRSFEVGLSSPLGMHRLLPLKSSDTRFRAFHYLNFIFSRAGYFFNNKGSRVVLKPGLKARIFSFVHELQLYAPRPRVSFLVIDEELYALYELKEGRKLVVSPQDFLSGQGISSAKVDALISTGLFQRVT